MTLSPLTAGQRKLRAAFAVMLAAALAAVALMPANGIPALSACVFKGATGLPCPLCGGTRAAGALLRGDFSRMARLNLLALPAVALAAAAAIVLGLEAARGRPVADWTRIFHRFAPLVPLAAILLFLWGIPHAFSALRHADRDLLDLRRPVAHALSEQMRAPAR